MLLLLGFAFLAGVVTVLSPCILPVLPVVLSGAVGGPLRPWGIVTGFTASFAVFTLTLSSLVQALGVDPDALRWVAAGLILVFGIILVVPRFKDAFLALASRLVQSKAVVGKPKAGYWSGVTLGLGLGVVWTPCVGPIMASVITLALSQTVDTESVFITLAYTVGTSLPLLGIMLGGRGLLNRFPSLTKHSAGVQRVFGGLMIITAAALFTGADRTFSTWLLNTFPSYGSGLTSLENQTTVRAELDRRAPERQASNADPLTLGQGTWINSMPFTLASQKGKVVLVDFWTYSCVNCVRTLPYLRAWYEKYKDAGLVIVGVHSPEFAFERSEANVRRAVSELGITWPVVQDNAFGIWNAYQNQYWPAHYLYDRTGKLIETHFGEGHYAETEAAIAQALGVPEAASVRGVMPVSQAEKTPETYLGYGRGERFASPEDVVTDAASRYSLPPDLGVDKWAYEGEWTIAKEGSSATKGALQLRFRGSRVYLVAGAAGAPVAVRVFIDGQAVRTFTVGDEKMYTVVDDASRNGGLLRLEFEGGVRVYAFTFG